MSIDKLYKMGDDAFSNLFEIKFTENGDNPGFFNSGLIFGDDGGLNLSSPSTDMVDGAVLRAQTVTIPAGELGTYEIHYKTAKLTKPNAKVEVPTELSFDFRVDKNWQFYKDLSKWRNRIANFKTGTALGLDGKGADDGLANYCDIEVRTCSVGGDILEEVGTWIFRKAYVKSVGEVSFDASSGDPVTVSVTMGFLNMDDWFSAEDPSGNTSG